MENRISELISELQKISNRPDSGRQLYPHNYMLIPGIIQSLELIENNLSKNPPDIEGSKKLARGLGRAVTEDFSFSESRLGTKLLDLVNELLNE